MNAAPVQSARQVYNAAAKAAFALPPRVDYDRWAEANIRLPSELSSRPGPLDLDYAPFSREVLRCYGDPRVRRVTYMKGSQIGGSLLMMIAACADADLNPGPSLYLTATADNAEEVGRERLRPMVEASIPRRLRPGKRQQRANLVRFDRMSLFLAGSNSDTQTRSRPICYLSCDEIDAEEFHTQALERAHQRVKSYPDYQIRETSSPGLPDKGVHAAYMLGSRAKYWVPCPHCGTYQTLAWERVRWEGGAGADRTRVKDEAVYVCESCGASIESSAKHAMLRAGRWVREGQSIGPHGIVRDGPDYRWSDHQSFQISSLYSPALTFGDVVAAYLAFGSRLTREFVTGWLGEPYRAEARGLSAARARTALRPLSEPDGYRLERVPVAGGTRGQGAEPMDHAESRLSPIVLIAGIDVQKDHAYYVVRGFGERMARSWLIDYGRIPAPQHHVERFAAAVDRVLDRAYTLEPGHPLAGLLTPRDGGPARLGIHLCGIDSGDRTAEVYQLVMRRPMDLVPTKGYDQARMLGRYAWSDVGTTPASAEAARARSAAVARAPDGLGAGGVKLLRINTDYYKSLVADMLGEAVRRATEESASRSAGTGSGRRLGGGGGGGKDVEHGEDLRRWHWPAMEEAPGRPLATLDEHGRPLVEEGEPVYEDHTPYLAQVTAEQLELVQRPGTRPRWAWRLRAGSAANHLLDCEVIASAVAESAGLEEYRLDEVLRG